MKYKVHSFTAALILIVMSAQLAFATSASQIPSKFGVPFAASATPGTTIRTIPLMTSTPGAASLTLGFPPITFTPIPSGGMAPDGRDFNGILNASTSWDQWFQLGGPIQMGLDIFHGGRRLPARRADPIVHNAGSFLV